MIQSKLTRGFVLTRKQAYNKLYYQKNKLLKGETIAEKRQALSNYKIFCGCKKCGFDDSGLALHFHHRKPENKSYNISQMLRLPFKELKKEMRKCDVLCANHHAITQWG